MWLVSMARLFYNNGQNYSNGQCIDNYIRRLETEVLVYLCLVCLPTTLCRYMFVVALMKIW